MRLTRNPLAAIRVKAGYDTAQEAATNLGVSRLHVLSVERGCVVGSAALLARMAKLYGVAPRTVVRAIRTAMAATGLRLRA